MLLSPAELRVLGSLIEKEITTPENYPLSLNALAAASNQRSSRDPVLDLTEEDLRQALHTLEDLGLVTPVRDSRVPKYEHRARTVLNLRRDETALLCLLLLRGPQTPGELRARADRLYPFDDLSAVTATLDRLAARAPAADAARAVPDPNNTGPLTAALPRQPGSREIRYTHLLGNPAATTPTSPTAPAAAPAVMAPGSGELEQLRLEVEQLRQQLLAVQLRLERLEGRSLPTA